jgi:hypothetical protein
VPDLPPPSAETEEKLGQAIHTNNASINKAKEALEEKI